MLYLMQLRIGLECSSKRIMSPAETVCHCLSLLAVGVRQWTGPTRLKVSGEANSSIVLSLCCTVACIVLLPILRISTLGFLVFGSL
jgi:hypothetical protein